MKPCKALEIALLIGCVSVLGACNSTSRKSSDTAPQPQPGPSQKLRDIRVRLDWTPWAPHAALYAAEDQGYFKAEGLRVKLYVPPDPEATIQLVAAGQDDFGISYMTDTIMARERGMKITSIGALVPHPLNCIMTLKSSGIDVPSKLKHRTIGTTGVPSDQAFLSWVLNHDQLTEHDVRLVNIGFDLAPALKSRRVDAIIGAYWPWEGIKLKQEGQPVNVMEFQKFGVPDYYELIIVARDSLLENDPTTAKAFLRAVVKGQEFVQAHPDEALQILARADPDLSKSFLSASLHVMEPIMQFPTGDFQQDPRTWSDMIAFMKTSGLIKSEPKADAVFTNSYLPPSRFRKE